MAVTDINTVVDQLVLDEDLRSSVLAEGYEALNRFDLERPEALAIVDALRADDGAEPFTHLRRQARFEPLFAAASASATKIG